MNKDPFDDFKEVKIDASVSNSVLENSMKKINPKLLPLGLKYGALFTGSIFLSLIICPQRGVGFLRSDYSFFHHILHQSEILCGLYCGFMFFMTTHLLTFFLLSHFERVKLVKTFSYLPVVFFSGFFGFSMTSVFSDAQFGVSYNLSWILVVCLSYVVLNYSYSQKYSKR